MNLVIKNCNCINQADISIEPNCLNIKYAMNGTGKSTISKAILLKSQDEDALKEKLRPYGKDEESDEQPEVSDIPYTKVKVFNDSYVSTKVLAKENFFDNPYMIFLNTGECDDLENKIKEMLDDLQEAIQNVHNLDGLRNMFNSYFTIFKFRQMVDPNQIIHLIYLRRNLFIQRNKIINCVQHSIWIRFSSLQRIF